MLCNLTNYSFDIAKISISIGRLRGAYCDENDLRSTYRIGNGISEGKAISQVPLEQLGQKILVNRNFSILKRQKLIAVIVHPNHRVSKLRKAGCRH